jgi:hypothetical protein
MQLNGERSRLGCCSVRLAPNIGGVAITKPWAGFERLYEPRGAAHCAGGALPISNRMAAPKRPSLLVYNALGGSNSPRTGVQLINVWCSNSRRL